MAGYSSQPVSGVHIAIAGAVVMGLLALQLPMFAFARSLAQSSSCEVEALIAFKKGVHDPQGALVSWHPKSEDPCGWAHITCNKDGKVIRVNLGNTGLSGHVAPGLAGLSSLEFLELEQNKLNGTIPSEIAKLSHLIVIHLQDNAFSGPIPTQLERLSNLHFLNLANNQLVGPIPTGGIFKIFYEDSFLGNPGLCGQVIHKPCN